MIKIEVQRSQERGEVNKVKIVETGLLLLKILLVWQRSGVLQNVRCGERSLRCFAAEENIPKSHQIF